MMTSRICVMLVAIIVLASALEAGSVSNHVSSEVCKRLLGSATRKALLALMADKASDYGTGIWASKQTMADELEVSKQTVITTIKGLVADGLLVEVGHRRCATGYLVEYAIDLPAVRALPLVKAHAKDRSKGLTGQAALPVKLDDPTGQAALPHQSNCLTQTIIEPSLNHTPAGGEGASARIPEDWKMPAITDLPASIAALARQWPAGAYEAEGEAFHQHWLGRGHRRADWAALWASRVQARHDAVMRSAKAGVAYAAAGSVASQAAPPVERARSPPSAARMHARPSCTMRWPSSWGSACGSNGLPRRP
jgi:biotin operon repressor